MPRSGGDADKLGNQYESFWTVECVLEVFVGRKRSITVEAFGPESKGVEFHLVTPENNREFYSAKRQTQVARGWSIYELCKQDKKTSRSILGDLFQKVIDNQADKAVFVSASGANDLREVVDRARNATSFRELSEALSKRLRGELQNRILPAVNNDQDLTFRCLKSIEVITRGHDDQKRITERQIESTIYRLDGEPNDNEEIRQAFAEFIVENLGPELTTEIVKKFVESKGLSLRIWKSDEVIQGKVAKVNQNFVDIAESELINQAQIIREESQEIVDLIDGLDSNGSLVVAPGGWGKSCVVAQVVERLKQKAVPFLALKLDSILPCLTTKQLGRQLDLPASPAIVLAGIADGSTSVLIVDQLDAMSLVSGRNPKMWDVFRQLRDEVADFPNMKMILACRDFDLDHDHRLRKLGDQNSGFKKIQIGRLARSEILKSLQFADVKDGPELNEAQLEILGVPFHLLLFLLGEPESSFSTVAELYDNYWRTKQSNLRERLGRDSRWNEVIDALTNRMSEDQSLIAPKIVVSDWEHDAENMASENVLVSISENRSYKFFHESFFDYAYARRFCSTGATVVEFLKADEQHLFRRSQVRQILAFRRENDTNNYLKDVKEIFDSPDVRFHIKRMVASQFRLIEKPTKKEWELLEGYFFEGDLARFVSGAIRDHEGWFDLLNGLGVFVDWLKSREKQLIDTAIWLLSQDGIHDNRSEAIADLLLPYVDMGGVWQTRVMSALTWGKAYKSEKMKGIYLDLIAKGAYDEFESGVVGSDFWGEHHNAEEESPKFIIEVAAAWFKRAVREFDDGESWNFLDQYRLNKSHTGAMIVLKAAKDEPLFFVKQLLPIAIFAIKSTAVVKYGRVSNRIWPWLSNHGDPFDIDDAILLGLRKALQWLAVNEAERFRELTDPVTDLPHETFAFLLLRSWAENPGEFANECAEYLVAKPARLHIGYSSWSGGSDGTGYCAVSRSAIQAISPVCSNHSFENLELAIAGYLNEYEKSDPSSRGFYQLLVLRSLDASRISQRTKLKIEELERKFPKVPDEIVPEDEVDLVRMVGSPIPSETCELMNDDQWISAMVKYDGNSKRSLDGGVVELSRLLQGFANRDRKRFGTLVDQIPDNVDPMYFSAILDGLCGRFGNLSKEEKEVDQKEFDGTATDLFLGVIDRLHSLPNRPCGSAIVSCIGKLSSRVLPPRLFQIMSYYATSDPDPEDELWQKETSSGSYHGGKPYNHGINCVRGQAAIAISSLLYDDNERIDVLGSTIEALVRDKIVSVRTCAIRSLLPMLNFSRDEAVRLFIEAVGDSEAICGSMPFERFIHYAVYTHYQELRPILQFALATEDSDAVESVSRQIILAELSGVDVGDNAAKIRNGDDAMRKAAADVYARNLSDEEVGDCCAQFLEGFFEDTLEEVRSEVSSSFFQMGGDRLLQLESFIDKFIQSKCFESGTYRLLYSLKESNVELPQIICRAAERVLEFVGEEGGNAANKGAMSASNISKLVVRQYEQATDLTIKSQCLDLIDRMEKVGYLGIGDELNKLDRR